MRKGAWNVAVVGAAGMVGTEMVRTLERRRFPVAELRALDVEGQAGTPVPFDGGTVECREAGEAEFAGVDIAIFSAGAEASRELAPMAVRQGAVVIDNSSAWRMDPACPLVVPEVNPHDLAWHKGIIANPNCSTIIGIVPIWPLHKINPVKRMVVSTYQAASGAGMSAMLELQSQAREVLDGKPPTKTVFPHQIAFNCFSHNSALGPNGYNEEETKLVKETRKIFDCPEIAITATCVRIPVMRAHCESINLEFTNPITPDQVREILKKAPGVSVLDDREHNRFPMPIDATGKDDVFVGRIRQDESLPNNRGINLWVSGDQLRKGAALNAIQIAELLLERRAVAA